MTANELLSDRFVAVSADCSIRNAISRMLDADSEVLLVIGQDGQFIGTVSDSVLLRAAIDSALGHSPVSLHMSRNTPTVPGHAPLDMILDQLVLHDLQYIPVIQQNRLAGIVQRFDLLRYSFGNSNVSIDRLSS